jgi:hypothetical protein
MTCWLVDRHQRFGDRLGGIMVSVLVIEFEVRWIKSRPRRRFLKGDINPKNTSIRRGRAAVVPTS